MKMFYRGSAHHIVVVPREDVSLFKSILKGDAVDIYVQNDLVDDIYYAKWFVDLIRRIAPNQLWRFNKFAGRPGWIIQQIVKLNIPKIVDSHQVAILDSDVVFCRPFDDLHLDNQSGKRILVRREPKQESARHREHVKESRRILHLPEGNTDHHYMAWPCIWYPDWVKELTKYLGAIHGKFWQRVLYDAGTISEYNLYGVFVEEVLRPKNLRIRKESFHHIIWDEKSYNEMFSRPLKIDNDKICLVIQSNLSVSVDTYKKYVEKIWELYND
ncbi:MAG: hypothetical protein JRJ38_04705 [Deltaproteobacteria bacterium]|nr:hypothetical protein [Deltaproteobacteria bacterium]